VLVQPDGRVIVDGMSRSGAFVARFGTEGATKAALNVQGLWWGGPSESGWGVNLAQQGSILFATWFTYDASGQGEWLVMSNTTGVGHDTYGGPIYRMTGTAFNHAWVPLSSKATSVGWGSFSFTDADHGTLRATVDGVTVTKPITRQVFDSRVPACSESGATGTAPNYQDLWWRKDGIESGWGLNLAHQGDTLFMTWFTYDVDDKPMWLVASNVTKKSDGTYSGALYRTTGPSFDSAAWDASRVTTANVGSVSFAFGDANNATFSYTVNGISGSKPITRQVFSSPVTVCSATF
jgi:hypothetical protein